MWRVVLTAGVVQGVELIVLLAATAFVLRGPVVLRWLRVVLLGLGGLVLSIPNEPLLASLREAGRTGPIGDQALVSGYLVALLLVALVAADREVRGRTVRAAGVLVVVATAALLLAVPPAVGLFIAATWWTVGSVRLAVTVRRVAHAHPGSLLDARLRVVAIAFGLLASSVLSVAGGPWAIVWALPIIGGTLVLWFAVAPPPFLQPVVSPTVELLRRTDRLVGSTGDIDADPRLAVEAVRDLFGGDAAVLVDDGRTVVDVGPARDVAAAEAVLAELRTGMVRDDVAGQVLPPVLSDGGTETAGQHALVLSGDRWVLAGDTGRGAIAVTLPDIGLLLTRSDRERMGSLAERVGLGRDRAEARLRDRQAASSLQAVERMRDDLLATLSHELRTPLTSIRGFSEVLRDSSDFLDAEQQRDLLGRVVEKSDQLERIITGLLELTAVRGRSEPERIALYDVRDLVERAVGRSHRLLGERTVAVEVPWAETHTDGGAVLAVLEQLLDNVGKFTPADTTVRVTGAVVDDGAAFELDVVDDGPGLVDPSRVFDPFVRGGDVLTRETRGVGIGLTIARELARQLGGDLACLDAPGATGAGFRFTFPLEHDLGDRVGRTGRAAARQAEGDPTLQLVSTAATRGGGETRRAARGRRIDR